MAPTWKNLSDAIFAQAGARPTALAISEGDERISYAELSELVAKAAVSLQRLGVEPREMVGVALPTNIDHIILSFALMRVGALAVDLPLRLPPGFPDPVSHLKLPRVFVTATAPPPQGAVFHRIGPEWRSEIAALHGDYRIQRLPEEPHIVNLTSGTTAASKAILTSLTAWLARCEAGRRTVPEILDAERPPQLVLAGGMGFAYYFFFLVNQLCLGGPVVLLPEGLPLPVLARTLAETDDALCLLIPQVCRAFQELAPAEGPLFPRMRAMIVSATPLFVEEKRAMARQLTPNLYEIYGTSGTGFISVLRPADLAAKPATLGSIAAGIEVSIVDGEGRAVPPGEVGHLRCRGPGMATAVHDPMPSLAQHSEGIRDDGYFPGDIGSIDVDGYLTLKGRVTDVIQRRGVEIFPPELEEALLAHGSVAEAAVLGLTVTGSEPQVVGFVVPRHEPDKVGLAKHCRSCIPANKFPDHVYFVREIPKNPNGKPDRAQLSLIARRIQSAAG